MQNLFSQLGKIAQQATGVSLPGTSTENNQAMAPGATPSAASPFGGAGDLFGKLKDSVPGGVGGLLGAGALGGILGALLSGKGVGKTVRKVGEGALVVGGTAAAATLAWTIYQKWSQNANPAASAPCSTGQTSQTAGQPHTSGHTFGPQAGQSPAPYSAEPCLPVSTQGDPMGLLVLEAMVYAARADGHLDGSERQMIHSSMSQLFPGTDVATSIDAMMNAPLDPERLARRVQNADQARDLYRLSRMVILVDHSMERAYLDALAKALGFSGAEQQSLDAEVAALQQAQGN